jgi:diacylglycerol O-acyltransferase / wax synthase
MVTRIIRSSTLPDAAAQAANVASQATKKAAARVGRGASKAASRAGQGAKLAGAQAAQAAQTVQTHMERAVGGTLGLTGERMSRVDTAWLRMDNDANLMMIVGVWMLRPSVRFADVCEKIEQRLLKFPRFAQRVVEDAAGATWVKHEDFNIEQHVLREQLAPNASGHMTHALKERVGVLAMQPLHPERPLWQMHVVENYVNEHGEVGSALIARIHHCIADGIALISVMMSLVDGGTEPPPRRKKDRASGPEEWIAQTLLKPFTDLSVKAIGFTSEQMSKSMALSMEAMADPQKFMQSGMAGSLDVAKTAMQVVQDVAALALMPDDSPTSLKGKAGRAKRVAWCEPLPLDEVKAVGKALGASVNDVLLACVAGAIGAYLQSLGESVEGKEIRAMVPVNLRPMEQAYKLGNRFGLVPLTLPIGMSNPIERVYEVRKRMGSLKGSYQPLLAFGVLAMAGLLIKPAQAALLGLFSKKTTAVMTNVPGPREKLQFCGSTLQQTMFWVPASGDVGMGVSILSYGGGVQFGLITDTTLCPEPQRIIDEFEPEFVKLSIVTLMLPWGEVA